MSNFISRRDFLKIGGAAMGGLAFRPFFHGGGEDRDRGPIVRVTDESISVFDRPDIDAETVGYRFFNELLNVYYQVEAKNPVYNKVWYRVWGGFIHSAFVQPVEIRYNPVLSAYPKAGFQLAEVTVPFTQPYTLSVWEGWQVYQHFMLYYGSTHWIVETLDGPDGKPWYKIEDELYAGYVYYVPAHHLRPVPLDELSPIAPEVPPELKRVEVSLENQWLTAYQEDEIVLEAPVSTGILTSYSTNNYSTSTPPGRHNIYSKMPSKNMSTGRAGPGIRSLPGVPWTSFFAKGGYAIHGTYWHNNFGVRMSSGCVNMRNADAKWLFRWMTPESEPHEVERRGFGTQVVVA